VSRIQAAGTSLLKQLASLQSSSLQSRSGSSSNG